MSDHAVARRDDPATSWAAAHSLDGEGLRESQRYLLEVLRRGPATQTRLEQLTAGVLSPSGCRTRLHELVEKGLAHDTGERERLPSGRQGIVWAAGAAPASADPAPGIAAGQTDLGW